MEEKPEQHRDKQGKKPIFKKIGPYYIDLLEKPLGEGKFAIVRIAYNKSNNNELVAVKIITMEKVNEDSKHIDQEINVFQQVKGRHVIHSKVPYKTTNNLYIFMEYFPGKNLQVLRNEIKNFPIDTVLSIVKQTACAFLDLEMKTMHRDIKPDNLLWKDGYLKIADFGFAKNLKPEEVDISMDHTQCGTRIYSSPQILIRSSYTYKTDIWSLGVIAYEFIEGKFPWMAFTDYDLYAKIKKSTLRFSSSTDEKIKNLISGMLQFDENNRFDWKKVYQHEALKDIKIPDDSFDILNLDKKNVV